MSWVRACQHHRPGGDVHIHGFNHTLLHVRTASPSYYAGWTDKIAGETLPAVQPGLFTYTRKVPIGVVGHIVPWNYPVLEMIKMIAPCIAAGCTSVYKTNEWYQSCTTPPEPHPRA